MMIPSIVYALYPDWSIGPMVIYIFTFLLVSLLLLLRSSARNLVGYSALLGSLSGLIYNAILVVKYRTDPSLGFAPVSPAIYVFYGIYIAFAFVPGLIGFDGASKESRSTMTKLVLYFGYLWAFFTFAIGLALTIFTAVKFGANSSYSGVRDRLSNITTYSDLLMLLYFSNWGFVPVYLILLGAYFKKVKGGSRYTLIAYSLLNIIAVIVFTIIANTGGKGDRESITPILRTYYAVMLVFCDISVAIALVVATYFGDTWRLNSPYSGNKLESFVTSEDPTRTEVKE